MRNLRSLSPVALAAALAIGAAVPVAVAAQTTDQMYQGGGTSAPTMQSNPAQYLELRGTVNGISNGIVQVQDEHGNVVPVSLHQSTVIDPPTAQLTQGERVNVTGYSENGGLAAKLISVPQDMTRGAPASDFFANGGSPYDLGGW